MQACSESRGLECSLGYSNSIVVFIRRRIRGAILTGCVRGAFYAQVASKRKETMAGIVRQRLNAISVPLSATRRDCDAFGFHPVAVHELERLRSAEQSAAYQRVANAAEKKLAIKRARCSAIGVSRVNHCCSGECGSAFRSGCRFNQQRCVLNDVR